MVFIDQTLIDRTTLKNRMILSLKSWAAGHFPRGDKPQEGLIVGIRFKKRNQRGE